MSSARLNLYIFAVFLILFSGIFALFRDVSIGGISVNVVFSILIAASFFFRDVRAYAFLVFLGALVTSFWSFFSFPTLAFILVSMGLYWLRTTRFEARIFLALPFIFFGTFILYLVLEPGYVTEFFSRVFVEAIYNSIVTAITFYLFHLYGETQ